MFNKSKLDNIKTKTSTFKYILLISLLLTSLGIFNGCNQLGIKENERVYNFCGVDYDSQLTWQEREKKQKEEEYRLKTTFGFSIPPNKQHEIYEFFINGDLTLFQKSTFKFVYIDEFKLTKILFVAHSDNFEVVFSDFKKNLTICKGKANLYIILATKNLLYIEKITDAIKNSNLSLYHVSIHSKEPSWYYIKGSGLLESIYLTGNHEVMGLENSLHVKEIYLHTIENIKEFSVNLDSTTIIYSFGSFKNKAAFPSLYKTTTKLKTLEMWKSDLDDMPDLSKIDSMNSIKLFGVNFKEIDLNKLPKFVRNLQLTTQKTPKVITSRTKKNVKEFYINIKNQNPLLQSELEKMKE